MAWIIDRGGKKHGPDHEGWPVGLQRDPARGLATDDYHRALASPADDDMQDRRVDVVQAACGCGWRSKRFSVAEGLVRWNPFSPFSVSSLDVAAAVEDILYAAWEAHVSRLQHTTSSAETELLPTNSNHAPSLPGRWRLVAKLVGAARDYAGARAIGISAVVAARMKDLCDEAMALDLPELPYEEHEPGEGPPECGFCHGGAGHDSSV
jgi:hypothetical protein